MSRQSFIGHVPGLCQRDHSLRSLRSLRTDLVRPRLHAVRSPSTEIGYGRVNGCDTVLMTGGRFPLQGDRIGRSSATGARHHEPRKEQIPEQDPGHHSVNPSLDCLGSAKVILRRRRQVPVVPGRRRRRRWRRQRSHLRRSLVANPETRRLPGGCLRRAGELLLPDDRYRGGTIHFPIQSDVCITTSQVQYTVRRTAAQPTKRASWTPSLGSDRLRASPLRLERSDMRTYGMSAP